LVEVQDSPPNREKPMKPPAVKFMLIKKDDEKERTGSPGDP
jgi:hypothetical protein